MREFSGKTLEDAIASASSELGVDANEIVYTVEEEKKGLFGKKVTINVYELPDIVEYAEDYILNIIDSLEIESSVISKVEDGIIRITIDSTHNPILIGKNGVTLQALNDLVKVAVSNHFKKRYRILLDVNGYKDVKYGKLVRNARRLAKDVVRSKASMTLDPMPADERRIIHTALANFKGVRTESIGEGKHRQLQIIYVGFEDEKPADDISIEVSDEELDTAIAEEEIKD